MLGAVPEISEHNARIGELPVFWRSAPVPGSDTGAAVPLYLHGVPGSSDEWVAPGDSRGTRGSSRRWRRGGREREGRIVPPPNQSGFLERSGGLAVDLPGFGRSGKPAYFDYTIAGYVRFLEQYLDLIEVERVALVVHDWGAVGLAFAQRHPRRIERLVVMDAVPLLPGYRWHRLARAWRTPLLGELVMGLTTRWTLRRASQRANVTPGPLPEAWLDSVLAHFDQGTQRAILRLYRAAPEDALARAGIELGLIEAPALVVWGALDPYVPVRFAAEYAQALPNAQLLEIPDAGHWWWLDRPEAIEHVVGFLGRS